MKKLNALINSYRVTAYGFPAFKALEEKSNQNGSPVILATDSPALMFQRGIATYYAPVLPRNAVFNTVEDILDADLNINRVRVYPVPNIDPCESRIVIVSRHQGTIDYLQKIYSDAEVINGNVTPEMLDRCNVVGTLPPALIQYCHRYQAATIKDFDYARDGDLSGQELAERLVLADAITVEIF